MPAGSGAGAGYVVRYRVSSSAISSVPSRAAGIDAWAASASVRCASRIVRRISAARSGPAVAAGASVRSTTLPEASTVTVTSPWRAVALVAARPSRTYSARRNTCASLAS